MLLRLPPKFFMPSMNDELIQINVKPALILDLRLSIRFWIHLNKTALLEDIDFIVSLAISLLISDRSTFSISL